MGNKSKMQLNNELIRKNPKLSVLDIIREEKEELFNIKSHDALLKECLKFDKRTTSRTTSRQNVGRVGEVARRRAKRCL